MKGNTMTKTEQDERNKESVNKALDIEHEILTEEFIKLGKELPDLYTLMCNAAECARLGLRRKMMECVCGSGKKRYELIDAKGIFVAYVCKKCEEKVKSKYRPIIFTDSNYEAVEEIEPEV